MSGYQIWQSKELVKKYLSGTRTSFPGALQQIEILSKIIDANKKPVKYVLDLGCGDGILGSIVLDKFPEAKGVFLDFSGDMLQAAKIKMAEMQDRIELIQYDYSHKGWATKAAHCAPYDVIVSGLSIHHQPDQRKREIYREIYQLLSPAGLFLNVEHVASRSKWIESISEENFIDALFAYEKGINTGRSREKIADEFHHRPEKEANILALVEDQCDWLREIGFQDVDCFLKLFEISVFGGRKPL